MNDNYFQNLYNDYIFLFIFEIYIIIFSIKVIVFYYIFFIELKYLLIILINLLHF